MAPINQSASVGLIAAEPLFVARRRKVRRWAIRPGLVLAGLFVLLLVIAAIQPHWLVAGDPLEASARQAFRAPDSLYWLGTDENGRDILTRLVYAVRPSLVLGLSATAIGLLAAIPAVIAYNKLSSDAGKIGVRMEGFADEFSAILSRQIDEKVAQKAA